MPKKPKLVEFHFEGTKEDAEDFIKMLKKNNIAFIEIPKEDLSKKR